MEIYSYTDYHYPLPLSALNRESWPVQYLRGFSEFYYGFYAKHILLFREESMNAWMPITFETKLFIQEAQFLHAPMKDGVELNATQQLVFFEKLIQTLSAKKMAHRIIQPHPASIVAAIPDHAKGISFGTYITYLPDFASDEALLNSFDPKYKKAIQHSIKNGAIVKFDDDVYKDFYKLYCRTTHRAGIHQEIEKYFDDCRSYLGEEHTLTGVVYDGEKAIGGIFIKYSKHTAYCTHAGSDGPSKLYGAMKYLHFEAMKKLRDKGVQQYDLVGVRIGNHNEALEGVFRFKKGFGGELREGFLWKLDLAAVPLKFYELLQKLKKNDAKDDIIDQELT